MQALAALRATREAEAKVGNELLPCIVGVPVPGERVGGKIFDGSEEAAVFPGDLPEDAALACRGGGRGGAAFRPLPAPARSAGGPTARRRAPHIRLDRALDFLLADWLR